MYCHGLQFVEVVQYVLQHYPDCDIEDLDGEVNLLLALPTSLALKVVRFNCCRSLTLQLVPGLMRKGIPPQKVTTRDNDDFTISILPL